MLGFGNAIPVGGAAWKLMDTYTSDFTGGGGDNSSDWGDSNVEGGSITFATNIDSIGGEDNWLRCTFPANQTWSSGIVSSCNNFVIKLGDYTTFTYKVYLSGDFEGSDPVSTRQIVNGGGLYDTIVTAPTGGAGLHQQNIPLTTVTTVTGYQNWANSTTPNSTFRIEMPSSVAEPRANDIIYIKDLEVKIYRNFG